jgi:hypothetical protein
MLIDRRVITMLALLLATIYYLFGNPETAALILQPY